MPKIICHNPGRLTGSVGSVRFAAGVGETDDPRMLAYFAADRERFEVVGEASGTPDPPVVPDPPAAVQGDGYEDMTVAELRKLAKDKDVPQSGHKDDLIERLRAADEHKE